VLWEIPEGLMSGYATNMLVQVSDQEFYLSFFEATPPIMFRPEDADKLEGVRAECIARIIVSPDRMAKFVDVMQQQLDTFNKKKKGTGGSDGTK